MALLRSFMLISSSCYQNEPPVGAQCWIPYSLTNCYHDTKGVWIFNWRISEKKDVLQLIIGTTTTQKIHWVLKTMFGFTLPYMVQTQWRSHENIFDICHNLANIENTLGWLFTLGNFLKNTDLWFMNFKNLLWLMMRKEVLNKTYLFQNSKC